MTDGTKEDSRTTARRARADEYFTTHLDHQRDWYDKKATRHRKWAQSLSFIVILAGGLTTLVQIFKGTDLAPGVPALPVIITAVLSLCVVVAEGFARIGRFQESWFAYRKASEQMKREYRLYINGAGGYEQIADEDAAYRAFVANVEQIIAEEQQLYWRSFGQEAGEKPSPPTQ
jgi:Protein of unknown function (DUF4231)